MQNKIINGFTLQRLLGTGGMAEVWYAENKIGKKAAVKLLLPKLCADDTVVQRFKTEAKVMVDLNHPNIRQVYDYGEIDGRPAIVMEYLDGSDLKARLKRGQRFTEEELKRWWNQMVDALNYTHKKDIVHRDIKPGNIFVDGEGNIKLLDFGIAKVRESISSTQTGQKLGTLMYMSPEQVKDSKHIDYRTDFYSLAVTFVHLITGKRPYNTDTSSDFEISEQIVYHPLDLSELPETWRNFLSAYLEKDPAQRPPLRPFDDIVKAPARDDEATMTGVEDSGQAPVDTIPQVPRLEPKAPKAPKTTKKKLGLWIGIGVAVVAALVLLLWWMTGIKGDVCEGEYYDRMEFVSIQATNFSTGKQYSAMTDKNGRYHIGFMRPGTYDLECRYIGYGNQQWVQEVQFGSRREVNFYLDSLVLSFDVNGVRFKMDYLEGGTFLMGAQSSDSDSPNYDPKAQANEGPVHEVSLSAFYMGETEVTQGLWKAVMDDNPSRFVGNNLPVQNVSYDDIVNRFLPKLNEMTGKVFRLPTEAEWEYAARGGTNTVLYSGKSMEILGKMNCPNLDPLAWYGGNCGRDYTVEKGCDVANGGNISRWEEKQYADTLGGVHPVAEKKPNDYGLYDVLGNVWEWCSDWYDKDYYGNSSFYDPQGPSEGSKRVLRGGGWSYVPWDCRPSNRYPVKPDHNDNITGFRIALSL